MVLSAVVRCGVSDHALRNAWRRLDATFLAEVQETMLGQSDAQQITAALDEKFATLG